MTHVCVTCAMLKTRQVPSAPTVARRVPPGCQARDLTGPECASAGRCATPVRVSSQMSAPLSPASASCVPSGLSAPHRTAPSPAGSAASSRGLPPARLARR